MDETIGLGWEFEDEMFETEEVLEPPEEFTKVLSTADYSLSSPLNKDGLNWCLESLINRKILTKCKLIPSLVKDIKKLSELDINSWESFHKHDSWHSEVYK